MKNLREEIELIAAFYSDFRKKTSKFVIVSVGLILGKVVVDGFTRPQQKTYGRYENSLKVVLKGLRCK